MGTAPAAGGFDRLPWLADEPRPRARRGSRGLVLLGAAIIVLVAAVSYWMGAHGSVGRVLVTSSRVPVSTTVPLPQVRQPQVAPDRVPEVVIPVAPTVRPLAEPQVPSRAPRARSFAKRAPAVSRVAPAQRTPASAMSPSARAGAGGRMVRIGAFGTRLQAKRGWWAMVRAYPALKTLRTVVVESRNSRNRRFYRLQIGTTSQAHSEVLCQRMEKIRYSCAVVGLPWKPGGVER
ncbi:MAG TPA: hypothetical protein VM145_05925 [Sphingomicrobium sp.]|nr:hypothetical protein [Sphingomicrobium sp.]